MPKVSIIVPIYNTEKYLCQCLNSISIQTYSDFEVILVNDGSTDGSSSICRSFEHEDCRFRYVQTPNRGLSAARNTGISLATGKYICLIDSDDWIEQNLLSEIIPSLERHNADVAIFWYYRNDTLSNKETRPNDVPYEEKEITKTEALDGIINETFGSYAWNKIYRKELFSTIEYPEEIKYCEDVATTHKLILSASKIILSNKILYHYRTNNASSLTHNFNSQKCFDAFVVSLQRYNDIKKQYPQFVDKSIFYILRSADFFFCHYSNSTLERVQKKTIISQIKMQCGNIMNLHVPLWMKLVYKIAIINTNLISRPYQFFSGCFRF